MLVGVRRHGLDSSGTAGAADHPSLHFPSTIRTTSRGDLSPTAPEARPARVVAGVASVVFCLGGIMVSSACDGSLLMLACRPLGSDTLTVAAFAPREEVPLDVGPGRTAAHHANRVQWYYDTETSWGFADEDVPVDRVPCDVEQSGDGGVSRLCWPMSGGRIQAGGRCGEAVGLDDEAGWERLAYHRP